MFLMCMEYSVRGSCEKKARNITGKKSEYSEEHNG